VGAFTIRRLRLNRPSLVALRCRRREEADNSRLLKRYRELIELLTDLHREKAVLLDEQQALLSEQRALLRLLLRED
jgi:hypothetical protein